ncbi:MAG TPA: WD40 repeat domain-containing protein [Ktedonobacteraceae bacterium]|nr:WD40 repeat domain-containing protein [Ktedonobacteraceae bacterium]
MKDRKSLFTLVLALLLFLPLAACFFPISQTSTPTPTPMSQTSAPTSTPAPITPRGKTLQVYRGHGGNPVLSLAWDPSGHLLASAGMDQRVNLWNATSGETVRTYNNMAGQLLWSHDGKRIAVTTWAAMMSNTKTMPVSILDATSNKILLTLSKPAKAITNIAWSPDNTRIASLSHDGEVQIWESSTGKLLNSYTAHRDTVDPGGIAWSPDGKYIASTMTTSDNPLAEVTIWNTTMNEKAFDYRLPVHSLAWSPDSTQLLSAGDENTVIIWDVATGKTLLSYKGHSDRVLNAVWSPDGQYVASAGEDKTVQIFNAKTGEIIFTYKGHQQGIFDLAWSPSGKLIASGVMEGNVHVWQAF